MENQMNASFTSQNLIEFLSNHNAKKEGATLSSTHTKIGQPKLKIYGGSYAIPEIDLPEFFYHYHKSVFLDKKMEYLTEKQSSHGGCILVDIDLRYEYTVVERIHTKEHIVDLILLYLDELKNILQFTEDTPFPIYIFEKPQVNRLEDKSLTKDGIHMIIGLQLEHILQGVLRDNIVKKINDIWTDIPIINTWDNVFDEGITKGSTNWQMFGSRKPGCLAYELTQYYQICFDHRDKEFSIQEQSTQLILSADNLPSKLFHLSAQYNNHPKLEYTVSAQRIIDNRKTAKKTNIHTNSKIQLLTNEVIPTDHIQLEDIVDQTTLSKATEQMLQKLSVDEYHVKEAHAYTQILPKRFYEPGSHANNTQVALALKHTDERLFLSWVMLRSKADDFDYSTIPALYNRWAKHLIPKPDGVTVRSIMYWAKEASKEEYDLVKKNTCNHYIEQTIVTPNDFDFATVLFHMYKDKYVCSNITNKTWYIFKNHRWELDRGLTLRMMISTEMFELYNAILQKIITETMELEPSDPRHVANKKKIGKLTDVALMLKKTAEKNNIMREAQEIFYDANFSRNIDTNRMLICFKNGVVDLENKVFRNGLPTDYITKCTNIDYEEYDVNNTTQQTIANEIKLFMEQLFPVSELRDYMWKHLASVLIGENKNQTFNIYHGRGSNGKSMLTDLMFMTLGEYAGSVPVTLITEKRPSIGGTSPEIMQLKGIRYAVMAEPKKGDRINEGIMKQLTGDSTISARALYCDTETFTIQFHLVVCTNTLFEMNSHDDGTWRRIRICDFESKFTEPDEYFNKKTYPFQFPKNKHLKDKMKHWVSIFAGMLVNITYENQGNVPNCKAIADRTNKYRRESDYISCFVSEKIKMIDPDNNSIVLRVQEIALEFKSWYSLAAPNEKAPKQTEIKEFITNKYGEPSKELGGWVGLKIIYNNTQQNDDNDISPVAGNLDLLP